MQTFILLCFAATVWSLLLPGSWSCNVNGRGQDYRGCDRLGPNGEKCLNWRTISKYKDVNTHGIGDHNYCRNPEPESKRRPWCYYEYNRKVSWCYCTVYVDDTDKCVTNQKDDNRCPKTPRARTAKPNPEPPEDKLVKTSSRLDISSTGHQVTTCLLKCQRPQWSSSKGNTYFVLQNSSVVLKTDPPILEDFTLTCSCSGKEHTYHICPYYLSECQQTAGSGCMRVGRKSCGAIQQSCTTADCKTKGEEKSDPDIDTETSTDTGSSNKTHIGGNTNALNPVSEGCTGYCGFCKTNPIMCGVVFICVGSLLVVIIINLLTNARWKKIASYLTKNRQAIPGDTIRKNDFGGFYQFKNCPPEPHYDHALNICRRFSDNDRQVTDNDRQISDNRDVKGLPPSLFSTLSSKPKNNLTKIKSNEFTSVNSLVCHSSPKSVPESPIKILLNDGEYGGRTMFDKYYDTEVEGWSICSDMETDI